MIGSGLSFIGVDLDEARSAATIATEDEIVRPGARARVLVIPTDEERVIVEDTLALTGMARTER
ncbi:MAG: hypothetical protein WEE03_02730 [Chloroflexota bacterium]